jgi:malonyl CoA-acyl carrier protein transacylase
VCSSNLTQVIGMGRSLVEHHETAAKLFRRASDILGYNLEQLCFEGASKN